MKKIRQLTTICMCAALVSALTACQTLPANSLEQQRLNTEKHNHSTSDTARMAQVERVNRMRGIDTMWVNPPRKKDSDQSK